MICSNCGKMNRDAARFCQYCGTSLPPTESRDTIRDEVAEGGPMLAESHQGEAAPLTEAQATEGSLKEGPVAIGPSRPDSSQAGPDQEISGPETGPEGLLSEALTEAEDLEPQAPIPDTPSEGQDTMTVAEAALQGTEPALAETGEGLFAETTQTELASDEGTGVEPEVIAVAGTADQQPIEPTETAESLAEAETKEKPVTIETDTAGEPEPEDTYQAEME